MTKEYYIGIMSGTSIDGIDVGLYDFSKRHPQTLDFYYQPYPLEIKRAIQKLCTPQHPVLLSTYGELDTQLGQLYAEACLHLLDQVNIKAKAVKAIGNHGQTLCHSPQSLFPFTLQIGDPNIISQQTGITTITDFRRRDIAAGGQGAPLVPLFHHAIFQSFKENRAIINIGGIANITLLPKDSSQKITGFDTGPGNTLMDNWISKYNQSAYDENGLWAASGKVHSSLLNRLKEEPYFQLPPPKSTGTEFFSTRWLTNILSAYPLLSPEDIQRTLCQLTAETITDTIIQHAPDTEKILICGGGIHNQTLLRTLQSLLDIPIASTEIAGVHPDQVEAMAFAWLAKQTLNGLTGNLPETTGAKEAVILGGIYPS